MHGLNFAARGDVRLGRNAGSCPAISTRNRSTLGRLLTGLALLLPVAGCGGCTDSSVPVGQGETSDAQMASQYKEELFAYAIDNLNRLEDINSPTMLQQIVDRLNQWAQTQKAPADWTLDPLLAALPQDIQELPAIKSLDKLEFASFDGLTLQEAIWLRDLSNWARGKQLDDLSRARRLFDWTVRNIQLDPGLYEPGMAGNDRVGQMPWETLLFGEGTAMDRAWVFLLLARQQGLDAALLGLGDPTDPAANPPHPWVVAVLVEGKLYLFDPVAGLPIPAAEGVRLDAQGQLDIQPATLAEVVADPTLLRRMDVDVEDKYPVVAEDLGRVVALIEASPMYLSRRARLVESHLAGKQKVVLTAAPTAQAERWKAQPHVTGASLWTVPFATIFQQTHLSAVQVRQRIAMLAPFQVGAQPALWKGRVLHLKGNFDGERSATYYYQAARPSNEQLLANGKAQADRYFEMGRQVNKNMSEEQIRSLATQNAQAETAFFIRAKEDASFWLGLIAFESGNYRSAIDYFATRTLQAWQDGPWTHAAKYNLARTYEASGQPDIAIQWYKIDSNSPTLFGNLLRARWLKELQPASEAPEPDAKTDAKPEEPPVVAPVPAAEPPAASIPN